MTCPFQIKGDRQVNQCMIGHQRGRPHETFCALCISHGLNTPNPDPQTEPAKAIWKRAQQSCADRAAEQMQVNAEWPKILDGLKKLAKPSDKGLGDIIARAVGPIGGDAFKSWYKQTFGKSCGCTQRQEWLNKKFPI